MKTKKVLLIGAVLIIVSTGFAFTAKSSKEKSKEISSSSTTGGFVLEDADQWK